MKGVEKGWAADVEVAVGGTGGEGRSDDVVNSRVMGDSEAGLSDRRYMHL